MRRIRTSAVLSVAQGAEPVRRAPSIALARFAVLAASIALLALAFTAAVAQAATHPFIPSLSKSFSSGENGCGAAVDTNGYIYAASPGKIRIYDPSGADVTTVVVANACGVAVDSDGALYIQVSPGPALKYLPSSFPPTGTTTYSPDLSINGTGVLDAGPAEGVAVDPATHDVYVSHSSQISQYHSDGTLVTATIGSGVVGASFAGIDVYGSNGDIYVRNSGPIEIFDPTVSLTTPQATITGSNSPTGAMGPSLGGSGKEGLAIDQSNGDVYTFDGLHFIVNQFEADGDFVVQIDRSIRMETGSPSGLAIDNSGGANDGNLYVASAGVGTRGLSAFGPLTPGPTVFTAPHASDPNRTTFTAGGTVNPDSSDVTECHVDYGLTSAYGSQQACDALPGAGSSPVKVAASLTGLTPGSTYHFRLVATNGDGTTKGEDFVFNTTTQQIPVSAGPCPGAGCFDTAGMPGAANFKPQNLAVDETGGPSDGAVYAIDPGNDAIDKFSASGAYLSQLKVPAGSFGLDGIPLDNDIAVDNSSGPGQGNVYLLSEGPRTLFAFDSVGTFLWQLNLQALSGMDPVGVGVDPSGDIWVADYNSDFVEFALDPEDSNAVPIATGVTISKSVVPGVTGAGRIAFDSVGNSFLVRWASSQPTKVSAFEGIPPQKFETDGFTSGPDIAVNSFYGDLYALAGTAQGPDITVWDNEGVAWVKTEVPGHGEIAKEAFGPGGSQGIAVNGHSGAVYVSTSDHNIRIYNGKPPVPTLNITPAGLGSGHVSADTGAISECSSGGGVCSDDYTFGATVTLTATPGPGSHFSGWSGDCAGSTTTCEITLDHALNDVTASFGIPRTLTIKTTGSGGGSVTCDGGPCAASYDQGSKVTLAAKPAPGSTFTGWSGGGCSGTGTCKLTIAAADITVSAGFALPPSGGGGGGGGAPVIPIAPIVNPPVQPPVKPIKCRKGTKKKTVHGKAKCVKVKKHKRHRR